MNLTMHIGWPQGILLALVAFGLFVSALEHGKPRSNQNAWLTLIATVIQLALLVWGGFFR
jgi:hypothetical protein